MTKRSPSPTRRGTTVSLCVIARDEESSIGACLDSAAPHVNEIIVLDTGSSDRTADVARSHGARVEQFAWCDDFAAARNAAIAHARSDWVLMLDADERLDPKSGSVLPLLLAAAPRELHCFLPRIKSVLDPNDPTQVIVSRHARLFRRSPRLQFVGAIHEDLVYLPDPARIRRLATEDLWIHHLGYDRSSSDAARKDARNLALLERALATSPNDPLLCFYTGLQHGQARPAEALPYLRRAAELLGEDDVWFAPDLYELWIECLLTTGESVEAEDVAQRAERLSRLTVRARELLAAHLERTGRFADAEAQLQLALHPETPRGSIQWAGTGGWRTHMLLAEFYDRTARPREALEQLDHVRDEAALPKRLELARTAASLAAKLADPARALNWCALAGELAGDDLPAQCDLFELRVATLKSGPQRLDPSLASDLERAVAADDWQTVYDRALADPIEGFQALAALLVVAEALRRREAPEAALDLLTRALDRFPARPEIYWGLVEVLKDLKRFDDALVATEVLTQLQASTPLRRAA